MAARRQHTVLRTCYYCDATLLKKGAYEAAGRSWKPVETGEDLASFVQQWLLLHSPVYEHDHRWGAQHKCPSCRSKILAFPPPDACGAAAAAFWSQQVCWQFGRTRCAIEFVFHPPSLLCVASCIYCAFVVLSVCLQVCDLHIADVETVTNEVVHTVIS